MKSFEQFIDDRINCFAVEQYQVIIEQIPLEMFERHIIGVDDSNHSGMKKFKVTFQYPKSKQMAMYNNPTEFVRYLLAPTPQDAKERVIDFIHSKPQPYLKKMNPKNMAIKTKPVRTWEDFIELASHILQKRVKNPISYFSQDDLNIFLKQAKKSKNFNYEIQDLPREIQLFLKRIYAYTVNQDLSADNRNLLNEPGRYNKNVSRREILAGTSKLLGKFFPTYQPKSPYEDSAVNTYSGFYDILKEAKLYGFTYKQLKNVRDQIIEIDYNDIPEKQTAWRDIKKRIRNANLNLKKNDLNYRGKGYISHSNSMLHDKDHEELDKFGGDGWITELVRWYPFLNGYNNNDNPYAAIYDFYKGGLPKMPPASQLWYMALTNLIQRKQEEREWKHQSRPENDEEIPF